MVAHDESPSSRVAAHRARLRQRGMKPVQMWLIDTHDPTQRKNLEQICLEIENYPGADEDRAFIYALSEDE